MTNSRRYYYRYVIGNSFKTYETEVRRFTTLQQDNLPTVMTSQVTNVTQTTATGGGNVTSAGNGTVTERGICWGTSHNPTTSGSHAANGTWTSTTCTSALTATTTATTDDRCASFAFFSDCSLPTARNFATKPLLSSVAGGAPRRAPHPQPMTRRKLLSNGKD